MVLYIFQLPGILLPSVDPRNQKDDNFNGLLVVLNVNNHICHMVIIILSIIQPLPILSTGEVLGQEYITKETILLSSWVSPNWVLAGRDHECASEDAQGSLGGTAEGQQSLR